MKNNATSNASTAAKFIFLGATLASIAATAYFFLGSDGKKNQKNAKAWAIKMKGDIIEKLEKAGEISEIVYSEIIDSVAVEYEKEKKAGHEEIVELAEDLKKHWKALTDLTEVAEHNVAHSAEKAVKKATK